MSKYRKAQKPTTGVGAILGKWPGEETDEEIEKALDMKQPSTTDLSIKIRTFLKPHDPSNQVGTCLWCGKKLLMKCNTEMESTDKRKPPKWVCCAGEKWVWNETEGCYVCSYCEYKANGETKSKIVKRTPIFPHGARGGYGDNAFCGLRCGYAFGVTMASFGRRLEPKDES